MNGIQDPWLANYIRRSKIRMTETALEELRKGVNLREAYKTLILFL
jgi:hypothetical protein